MLKASDHIQSVASDLEQTASQVESCFDNIHRTRMHDVPILNTELRVQLVGLQRWDQFQLGVLITPWFINLVLLPAKDKQLSLPRTGESITLALPAGKFDFIAAYEESIGQYLFCSLLSPVQDITTQDLAEEVARESLNAILKPEDAAGMQTGEQQPAPDTSQANGDGPRDHSRRALFKRIAQSAATKDH